jgi:sec-independent protein translocase protein TatA
MGFVGGHLWEIAIVLVVVLIIWGPGKLPDIGGALGKGIREFRQASSEARDSVVGTTATPAPTAPVVPTVAAPMPAPAQPAEPVTVPADATANQHSVPG